VLGSAPLGIGRDAGNEIVLDGVGVSSFHCTIEINSSGVVLTDRGSRNGTWISGKRVEQPVRLGDDDRVYVGPFLLQIVRAAMTDSAGMPIEIGTTGPIVRGSGPHRKWRDTQAKLERYAEQWEAADRPTRLLLGGDELRQARRWLATPPPSPADEPGRLVRELIAASAKADARRGVTTIVLAVVGVLVLGGAATLAFVFWPESEPPPPEPIARQTDASSSSGDEHDEFDDDDGGSTPRPRTPVASDAVADVEGDIEHVVVPGERLADIAKRYGVDEDDIVEWNLINRDKPLDPSECVPPAEGRPPDTTTAKPAPTGQVLKIKKPRLRPLPQTCILYEVEAGESWAQLSTRFGIEITRLREYNPGVTEVKPGQKIVVWIDPKPYKPREPRAAIAELNPSESAKSVGTPNAGKLVDGIQLPENAAYTRKAPNIMYGSAYFIKNLHKAIVTFRQDVDYDGALIVADISKKNGGHFDPHKSHQAGRDVDIWLPTLKGVYKTKYLGSGKQKERRPFWYEVDWYATWGLMRALIKTGAVEAIFLDIILQPYVHNAAKNMGATDEELAAWIQYPAKYNNGKVFVQHSADHYSHIHVRFKCGPAETECKGDRGAPGD
jgi:LysM repeat protein